MRLTGDDKRRAGRLEDVEDVEKLLLRGSAGGKEREVIEKKDITVLEEFSERMRVAQSGRAAIFVDEGLAGKSDNALPGGETFVANGVQQVSFAQAGWSHEDEWIIRR